EGAVQSTVDILKTLKEKVVNAANDTNTDMDRQTIQKELNQSVDQINDNANVTYNGKYLIDGSHNSQVVHDTLTRGGYTYSNNTINDMVAAGTPPRGTFTHLTNYSLATDTTYNTFFTDLKNRNGESLGIQSTDTITLSIVQEGKTYTTSFQAGLLRFHDLMLNAMQAKYGDTKIDDWALWLGDHQGTYDGVTVVGAESYIGQDASGNDLYTPDGEAAFTWVAATAGLSHQVAGFTVSVTDNEGNIKKSVNAVLDDWRETIRAQEESPDNSLVLQVGTKANQSIKVGFTDMRARALGLQGADGTVLNISTQIYANAAVNVLDNAMQKALDEQTKIGSIQSRLAYTSANLTTASENVTASESTIRDADMAKEMTEYTKHNLLLQASQSMLSQANQSASNVLSLLQQTFRKKQKRAA
ncbi:MAG: hypothetical protein E7201_11800, partial [Selenomonas ruminantium]|nr:hypothetical protein [Selenomonas ruminantium]